MDSCCSDKACAIEQLRERQAKTLKIVLVINAGMFLIEFGWGILAGSIALLADSLDMLGDALVYAFSLYVVALGMVWKARAAMAKAAVMALFGMFVLVQLVVKVAHPHVPMFETMGAIGALALAANGVCFALLWRHRSEDINMRSVWLCSRNDLIANAGVIAAAMGVWATSSAWPDLLIGALICAVFVRSAFMVFTDARRELRLRYAE